MNIEIGSTAWIAKKAIAAQQALIDAREGLLKAAQALILAEDEAKEWQHELDGAIASDMAKMEPHPECRRCEGTGVARDEFEFGTVESGPCECLSRDDEEDAP